MRSPNPWPIILLALVTSPALAWAQDRGDYYHGPHMMWGGWHGMFIGLLMMIIVITAVIALVVLAVRWFGGPGDHPHVPSGPHAPPGKSPVDILKERFARGEIDKDEFEERRRVLGE